MNETALQPNDLMQALLDLEKTAKPMQRGAERRTVRTQVTLLPANTVDRPGRDQQGVCQDVSRTGCKLVTPIPPTVGSTYYLKFDPRSKLGDHFGRCLRCHILREDVYEAAFAFFRPLESEVNDWRDLADMV